MNMTRQKWIKVNLSFRFTVLLMFGSIASCAVEKLPHSWCFWLRLTDFGLLQFLHNKHRSSHTSTSSQCPWPWTWPLRDMLLLLIRRQRSNFTAHVHILLLFTLVFMLPQKKLEVLRCCVRNTLKYTLQTNIQTTFWWFMIYEKKKEKLCATVYKIKYIKM